MCSIVGDFSSSYLKLLIGKFKIQRWIEFSNFLRIVKVHVRFRYKQTRNQLQYPLPELKFGIVSLGFSHLPCILLVSKILIFPISPQFSLVLKV